MTQENEQDQQQIRRMSISDILRTPGLEGTLVEVRGIIAGFHLKPVRDYESKIDFYGMIVDKDLNGKLYFETFNPIELCRIDETLFGFSRDMHQPILLQGGIAKARLSLMCREGDYGYVICFTGLSDGVQYKTEGFVVLPE